MTNSVTPGDRYDEIRAALGQLDRAANASIRGYLTQIVYTALAWLDLTDNEVLIVEGREDVDKILLDADGRIREVNEVQLKDLSSAINARSEAVRESIFNFLLSYQYHQEAGRRARMQFATTACLKGQSTAKSTAVRQTAKTTRLDLEVDVILTWVSISDLDEAGRSTAVPKLARAVRGLFDAYLRPVLPDPAKTTKTAEEKYAESVLASIDWYDASSTWKDFFGAVSWVVDLDSARGMVERLKGKIADDSRLSGLPDAEFAQVLIYRVLSAASKEETTERFLTREDLQSIADDSAHSLRQWADRHGLVNLSQWQFVVEETLKEHGERLDELEITVAAALPTLERARSSIADFTRIARRRVRLSVGAVHVTRQTQLTALGKNLKSARTVVVLGASGTGKSALVRSYTEKLESESSLTLWLGGASLERADLASLQSDICCGHSLQSVFESHPGRVILVIDGLDRVFENSALTLLADVLDTLGIGGANASCDLLVTCQTPEWPRLERVLRRQGVDVSGWALQECPAPNKDELEPIWQAIPAARRLALEPRLATLLRNLKVLDLIASQLVHGADLDPARFVGESSVASWFWDLEVAQGPQRRARDVFSMRLGELQADRLRLSVSLSDIQVGDASIIAGLEADGVCVVDERNHVLFSHDLFADWARLRALQSREADLGEFLRPRVNSPLWHRAIRLLGASVLDERNDVAGWSALFGTLQQVGGDSVADLLLESIVFSANAASHLELLAEKLLEPDSGHLDRLLGRFLAFATLPEPRMCEIGRSVGMSDAEASALYRYPNWPYWPAVIRFLHRYRDRATKVAARRVGQVVKLWLKHTPQGTRLRRETGELGLLLGHFAIDERSSLESDERTELLSVALAGVPECENEVVEFALFVAERTTEQKPDERNWSIIDQMHPNFNPNEEMPPPAPDGPRNRVDEDFRTIILEKHAMIPLMRRQPAVAREVILACLLASRHIGQRYFHHMDEWSIDLAPTTGSWFSPVHFRGPFAVFLQVDFAEGLDVIARLVDFVAAQWVERRRGEGTRDQHLYDRDSPGQLHAEIGGVQRTFLGDGRTLGWSAGLGLPLPSAILTSALMALEQHLYTALDSKADIESMVCAVLERTNSVPFLHVLLDVGRKELSLFAGPLLPLLGIPELYSWELVVQAQGRVHLNLVSPFEGELVRETLHEFNSLRHRSQDLREIAVGLFLSNKAVSDFLSTRSAEWTQRAEGLQSGSERSQLLDLAMMFNKDNYEETDLGDGCRGFVNVALQKRAEAMQEEMAAHKEAKALHIMPQLCRRLLDEEAKLDEDTLQELVNHVRRAESTLTDGPTSTSEGAKTPRTFDEIKREIEAGTPAQAFVGGIAVLLCLHYDWVAAQPELLAWCRSGIVRLVLNPPARPSFDVHESTATWTWDCFAVEATAALWSRSPEDPELRQLVAILVFSYHNVAVRLLMRSAGTMILERFADVQRLRRLVFENAHIRNRINFVQQRTQPREGFQQAIRDFEGWHQRQIANFVDARSDEPAQVWAQMDNSGLFSELDESRRRRYGSYLLDFKLVRAAHESELALDEAASAEERKYRVWFLKSALDFWTTIVIENRRKNESPYPREDECWLLDKLAAAITVMTPEEKPEEIWERLVTLPTDAHHWSEVFLRSFYRVSLAADPVPASLAMQIQRIVTRTLELAPEKQWAAREDVWQVLYGVHQLTRDHWKARHVGVARCVWLLMKKWISRDPAAKHVTAVARWLTTEAASSLRLDGLQVLHKAVQSANWSYGRQSAENAIADMVQVVWEGQAAAVRNSSEAKAAFQQLLRWLGERQNVLGLELLGRVGQLSPHSAT